jgi:hypothetical protein
MPGRVLALEHPAEQVNEKTLIRRVCDGEHELFYELIRPSERRVYAAFAILRNDDDAEDVAQEAALKAFKHIRARVPRNFCPADSSVLGVSAVIDAQSTYPVSLLKMKNGFFSKLL